MFGLSYQGSGSRGGREFVQGLQMLLTTQIPPIFGSVSPHVMTMDATFQDVTRSEEHTSELQSPR